MSRSGWLVAAAVALVAFYVGKGLGPAPIGFPDPSDARDAAAMEAAVAEALAEPRAFPRTSALIRLFEGLTTENVEGAARAVEARAGEYDPVDLQLFLTAWTHLDPSAAMRAVQGWPIRSRRELGIRIVMREWAASGRQIEAGAYFDTLTDPDQRELAAGPLVRGWALAGDAEGALGLALRFWEADGRRDVIDALIRGVLHTRGADGTFELARRVDPKTGGEFAQRVAQTALNLAGRSDPRAAAAYYDELAGTAPAAPWLVSNLPRIAGLLRNESPELALDWLLPKAPGPERTRGLMETAGTWAKLDFDAAWAWFEQHAESARDAQAELSPTDSAVLAGLVRRMARIRPVQAAPWALRLRPESDRVEMLRRVAYFWSASDAPAADAWIAGLALDANDLARIREGAEWGRAAESSPSN
ncbi:MAG: hypothetical protein IPK00_07250 [Deltaproteobacteria bacterium]|nr:hypothetical protein [Deltaproteobacteria bacterium]